MSRVLRGSEWQRQAKPAPGATWVPGARARDSNSDEGNLLLSRFGFLSFYVSLRYPRPMFLSNFLSRMFRQFRCLMCDLTLFARSLTRGPSAGPLPKHSSTAEGVLYELIREVPWWAKGHVKACRMLIDRAEKSPLAPQELATLRWTAEAARRLMSERAEAPGALYWESELVWAKTQMLEKKFSMALEAYRQIVSVGGEQLSQPLFYQALEDAAACAMVLGADNDSKEFLGRIPERYRSVAARAIS